MLKNTMMISILLLLSASFNHCLSSTDDEIKSLPGLQFKPAFRQYSGYLSGGQDIHIFYWFVESQSRPQTDPVLLWLNGGPMCSSLMGLLSENGPFNVANDGRTLTANPNSWNNVANVLYMESPVGVGFSYTTRNDTFENDDDTTARISRLALEDFFRKFPHLANNSFYITGFSYAGVYIPTLAVEIYRSNATINLKGLAIGSGLLDQRRLANTYVELSVAHGWTDAKLYDNLVEKCCSNVTLVSKCDLFSSRECASEARKMIKYPNSYSNNIYQDCNWGPIIRRLHQVIFGEFLDEQEQPASPYSIIDKCLDDEIINKYLDWSEVREAIHCSDEIEHWFACGSMPYNTQYSDMKSQFRELLEEHKISKIIVFNGDLDMNCDFLGDQRFVDSLGYRLEDKYDYWTHSKRVAGFVKRYERLTYVLVRGAGHVVQRDQPEAALEVIKELIGLGKLKNAYN